MTVTIHWSEQQRRGDLVRALQALAGAAVKVSAAGVIVPDDVAARWLQAHVNVNGNGHSPDAHAHPPVAVDTQNGAIVEIWTPPPSDPGGGEDGLNEVQRAALATIRRSGIEAIGQLHPMTLAALRRRGLIPDQAPSHEESQ